MHIQIASSGSKYRCAWVQVLSYSVFMAFQVSLVIYSRKKEIYMMTAMTHCIRILHSHCLITSYPHLTTRTYVYNKDNDFISKKFIVRVDNASSVIHTRKSDFAGCLSYIYLYILRYLEGDQLRGTASVEAYISALEKGCRCVERMLFLNDSLKFQNWGDVAGTPI